ncbi:DUF6252 family protein [Pseudopedobacter beijingensis]|uniref:DUF6252 family protein n=1 Tax=Pseudopedobacter beijingensis TaxID=1207056 RepID=A0ABW4IC66_9SPHI
MRIHLILFWMLLTTFAVSCKKEKQQSGYMNASVNGKTYKSIQVNAYFPASSNKGILSLKSSADGERTISLIINNYKGTGTYYFKSGDIIGQRALCTYSYTNDNRASIVHTTEDANDNGYITVTKEEGSIVEGTFQFKALYSPHPDKKEYVKVTSGSFSMHF